MMRGTLSLGKCQILFCVELKLWKQWWFLLVLSSSASTKRQIIMPLCLLVLFIFNYLIVILGHTQEYFVRFTFNFFGSYYLHHSMYISMHVSMCVYASGFICPYEF